MNVVFATATRGWAGVKTWMLELGSFLARRGHTVSVVCRRGNAMQPACEARGVACHGITYGPDFSPRTIRQFTRLLRAQHTEVLVTNISKDIRTAGVAARLLGVAHVNRLGASGDVRDSIRARLEYHCLVDRVFVASHGLLEHYQSFPFLARKLRRFPNAVVPPPWVAKDEGPVRFAVIAHLSQRKQVDQVLRVFSRLDALCWELHVAGSGPELPALKRLATSLGLTERIHFTCDETQPAGLIDAPAFLKDKHVGILYSRQEAFGLAILEYMASSCAVIASAVDGPKEILRHEDTGLLVDPADPDTLESAVRRLIASPEQRTALAHAAHASVCREYHQDVVFPTVEAELQQVAAERCSPPT